MGKVNDYISGLDKKENLDPLVIASTLLELHNEEIAIAEGKIASLETEQTKFVTDLAEKENQITGLKAKNWDLVNRVPASNTNNDDRLDDKSEPGNESFDDFFKESE